MFGIIGPGKLAQALVTTWQKKKLIKANNTWAITKTVESSKNFQKTFKIKSSTKIDPKILKKTKIILLAVKPKQMIEAITSLKEKGLSSETLIISVLAGTLPQKIESALGQKNPVIVLMTNTGARSAKAMSAIIAGHHVSKSHMDITRKLAAAVGEFIETKADDFNIFTAAAGSGIAFVYLWMQIYSNAIKDFGMGEVSSEKIAKQVFLGAATMALNSDKTLEELISEVATPGGCTELGLTLMKQQNWSKPIEALLKATAEKAGQLSA
ncbi:MAG: NAD(P)-binding domain-containing protein [Proteobacteria bacterium]|nr:NAD(P)-binding domain-containing protein [Pseudomonadota bacterium]